MRLNRLLLPFAAFVIVLALNPVLVSSAAKLITGEDIRDDTITSADIRDGTIGARDLGNGAVSNSPSGSGQDRVVTEWSASFEANGSINAVLLTAGQVAAFTELTPVRIDLNGDFSSCTSGTDVTLTGPGGNATRLVEMTTNGSQVFATPQLVEAVTGKNDGPLRFQVACWSADERTSVPSYSFRFVFETRHQGTSPSVFIQ